MSKCLCGCGGDTSVSDKGYRRKYATPDCRRRHWRKKLIWAKEHLPEESTEVIERKLANEDTKEKRLRRFHVDPWRSVGKRF